jgi:thioredoxin 1
LRNVSGIAVTENTQIFDVHEHDFKERVLKRSFDLPVLVDFWADWCSPCHMLAPHLYKAVESFNDGVELAKLEVDEGENMKLAGHYRVRGFPTVIIFVDGKEIARFASAKPTHWIEEWITEHVGDRLHT